MKKNSIKTHQINSSRLIFFRQLAHSFVGQVRTQAPRSVDTQAQRRQAVRRALKAPNSTNRPGTKIIAQMIELRLSLTQVKLPNR